MAPEGTKAGLIRSGSSRDATSIFPVVLERRSAVPGSIECLRAVFQRVAYFAIKLMFII